MPRSRPPYSPEYRQQMVDLVRGGPAPALLVLSVGRRRRSPVYRRLSKFRRCSGARGRRLQILLEPPDGLRYPLPHDCNGLSDLVANQPELPALLERARAQDVGVVAMKTLMGARLNDLRPDETSDGTFAQAAFRWVLSNPNVDTLIISMKSVEMIDEYLGASGSGPVRTTDLELLERYASRNSAAHCRLGLQRVRRGLPARRGDPRGPAHAHVRDGLRGPCVRSGGLREARSRRLRELHASGLPRIVSLRSGDRAAHTLRSRAAGVTIRCMSGLDLSVGCIPSSSGPRALCEPGSWEWGRDPLSRRRCLPGGSAGSDSRAGCASSGPTSWSGRFNVALRTGFVSQERAPSAPERPF